MEAEKTWSPGQDVRLIGPRLIVHTLRASDLDDSLDGWMGSTERNQFVWKPQMSALDYMTGLIRHCDALSRFIFGIYASEAGQLIGYRKVLLASEDNGRGVELSAIPTTLIGDRWSGQAYGQEAGGLVNWFLLRALKVRSVSPRIYEANEKTWRLGEQLGYRLVRRETETTSQGKVTVRRYTMTAEELEERGAASFAGFRMEVRS